MNFLPLSTAILDYFAYGITRMEDSLRHANHCRELPDAGSLAAALSYCKAQRIDSPQCSLTAKSANADNLRAIAKKMLVDAGCWSKRLRILEARDHTMAAIRQGLAA